MVKVAIPVTLTSSDGRFTFGIVRTIVLPAAISLTPVSSIVNFRDSDSHAPVDVTPARAPEKVGVKLAA